MKKYIYVCLVASCILMLSISFCYNKSTKEESNHIADIFLIDDQAFQITLDGELYSYDDTASLYLTHDFPSHLVYWSDSFQKFLYYDDRRIHAYDVSSDQDDVIFDLRSLPKLEKTDTAYVICSTEQYIFLRYGKQNYKVDIVQNSMEEVLFPIQNLLFIDEHYLFYQSSDYQTIGALDYMTGKNHEIVSEDTDLPVTSACRANNVLFYVRSDGKLRSYIMENISDFPSSGLFPKNEVIEIENILALDYCERNEKLICVVGERQNDLLAISIVAVNSDGSPKTLRTAEVPYSSVPGTFKLMVGGDKYIFAIAGQNFMLQGSL